MYSTISYIPNAIPSKIKNIKHARKKITRISQRV